MSAFYSRSQVQRNGLTQERIDALMFFLWGSHGREGAYNEEAYDCDLRFLQDLMWKPVDVQLTLCEVMNL